MYMSVVLVCSIVASAYAWLWGKWRRARRLLAHLPTYPRLPLIGNFHKFYGGGEVILNTLTDIASISEERDLPFVMWLGPYPVILLYDIDDVKAVTNAFVDKPYYYSFGKIWLGEGLVTAPVSTWKRNIKKLSGTFSSSVVNGYQDVFNAQAQRLVAALRTKAGSAPFNALNDLALTTLETICQTALGVCGIGENIVSKEYYKAFNRSLELLMARGLNLLLHPDVVYQLTPAHREMTECVNVLHSVADAIIKKRTTEWHEKKQQGNRGFENSENSFKSFLDILFELSENDPAMTPWQIKAEVDTIIVGGQETVATTLFYALLMIGCHREVQDRLYSELKEIFGDSKRAVEKEDLSRMTYCEAVILETLRLFPPVPAVMRLAERDLKLKSCTVPRGAGCVVSAWGAGRSRRAWGPRAARFEPARWLSPPGPAPAPLLAFSYGRRACIGRRYSFAILKTMLAWCVRELEFTSEAYRLRLKFDLVLRPVSGHLLQVKIRDTERSTII